MANTRSQSRILKTPREKHSTLPPLKKKAAKPKKKQAPRSSVSAPVDAPVTAPVISLVSAPSVLAQLADPPQEEQGAAAIPANIPKKRFSTFNAEVTQAW